MFVRPVRRAAFVHEFSAEKRGDDATSEAPSAPRRGRVFVLHGPTVRAGVAHEHLGIRVPHDEIGILPGRWSPSSRDRRPTRDANSTRLGEDEMRSREGALSFASSRARECVREYGRGRKPNRRKYAEVCFKSPPRRRRRLPIDKSTWYVAGNERSVDSAAYWWGIKPPYPTAPVPSRIRAEKTTTKEPKSGWKNDGVRGGGNRDAPASVARETFRRDASVHVAGRLNCKPAIPPHARRKSPSSTSFSAGGAGSDRC